MPSGGHGLLAFVYVSINIIIMFTNMDNSVLPMHTNIAARTGWYVNPHRWEAPGETS